LKTQELIQRLDQIKSFIGNTPLIPIPSLSKPGVQLLAKAEWCQLSNSVKARAGFQIIKSGLESGDLVNKTLLDASSGNTAIAYASIAAKIGLKVKICLPENATNKRKEILRALGAELLYTPEDGGTDEARRIAKKMSEEEPEKYFYANQYDNPANWQIHYQTTAEEIFQQTAGKVTHFVACLGTTGTFVGNAKRLKELNPEIVTVGLQPDRSDHVLEGWKHMPTASIPGIYSEENMDETTFVESDQVEDMVRFLANHEGLLLSPSSAANLMGAKKWVDQLDEGIVVAVLPDDISKYDELLKKIAG